MTLKVFIKKYKNKNTYHQISLALMKQKELNYGMILKIEIYPYFKIIKRYYKPLFDIPR